MYVQHPLKLCIIISGCKTLKNFFIMLLVVIIRAIGNQRRMDKSKILASFYKNIILLLAETSIPKEWKEH